LIKYILYIALIIAINYGHPIYAENAAGSEAQQIGVVLDYRVAEAANNFSPLSGTSNCCTDYDEFTGRSYGVGLQYYYPFYSKWSIRFRIGYYANNLELRNVEAEMINVGGELFDGQFEHILSVDYSNYFTQITAGYNIYKDMTIVFGGKLLINKTLEYEQYERIIRPKDRGVFVDTETRTRNEFSGEISTLNKIIPVITIGALYDLPLNKNKSAILSPEITFESNLNSLIKGSNWNIYSIHFGISISFNINK